jgi:N-acetyl-gamma-glutamyl-phosphate reductase
MGAVFPHLAQLDLPDLIAIDAVAWDEIDAVFCCLPHGTTQETIAGLPAHVKVVDLSADFRLKDPALYERIYGGPHRAIDLQKSAVYGLTEIRRDDVRAARLVANPGCYTTAAELPLIPLLEADLIERGDIIVDAKSGVSGAGRAPKETNLHTEVSEGIQAYAIASHRHTQEIEQELSAAAGEPVVINFTPHLMPMNRGILATTYVRLKNGARADDLRAAIARRYAGEPFVKLVPQGQAPSTHHVRGSNLCLIGVFADRLPGRAILISALDNLVKGASGQALQNMNLMLGLQETAGLDQPALFP